MSKTTPPIDPRSPISKGDRTLIWILATWVVALVLGELIGHDIFRGMGPKDPVIGVLAVVTFFASAIWFNVAPIVIIVILIWRRVASKMKA